jgi:hypothetical protein
MRLRHLMRPSGGDVVTHHVVAAAREVAHHGRAHVAQADEANASRRTHGD